jgi:hypothetical protein
LDDCSDDYFNWVEDMFDSFVEYFHFEREIDSLIETEET